jgi:hypothetical protein
MRAVAKALREEDAKKNTNKRVGMLLGVDEGTVRRWLLNGSNRRAPDTSKPDARVKVPPQAHAVIADRVKALLPLLGSGHGFQFLLSSALGKRDAAFRSQPSKRLG